LRHEKIGQSSARSQITAFHNFTLNLSDPALHEITFHRAQEEPVPASFPGVVFFLYPNELRKASTKITIYSMIYVTLICYPICGSFWQICHFVVATSTSCLPWGLEWCCGM
jgi:hypothetical protein